MTRARDELYLCGFRGERDPPETCWYGIASRALEPHVTLIEGADPQRWRLGAEPQTAKDTQKEESEDAPLPLWIADTVAQFQAPPLPAEVTARDPQKVARGILIHRILQWIPDIAISEREARIRQAVTRAGADPALGSELAALIAHPDLAELLSPDGLSEVPLMIEVPGQAPQRRRIDRLMIRPDSILIADYKTDRAIPASIEACNPDYIVQMAQYRYALRRIHPGTPLEVVIVWTEVPLVMRVPDTLMDRMGDQLSVTRP
jgi:ATP-dependent helicase/nuclease subunit A